MAKYSIVVPVYNSAPFLQRCLDSILNQDYDDYEIIIVNDGSTDNSEEVIKKYKDDHIKYFKKENGGVSDARNYGVNKVISKYFMFVDADDYIDTKLLAIVDKYIGQDTDVLSFNIALKDKYDKLILEINKPAFIHLNGEQAIVQIINSSQLFDTPVAYVYRTSYFKDNSFKYAIGRVHEDFGLTPLIIVKANCISSISNHLYYYVENNDSITKNADLTKIVKRAWDMLYHFDYLYMTVNDDIEISDRVKHIFNSFIANAVIERATILKGKYLREYITELKNRHVASLLLSNNLGRLIKKIIIKINMQLYIKILNTRR